MARRYQKIGDALRRRSDVTERCISDAERDKDTHHAALLKVRLNEMRTILQCIESNSLELL
jgi:hypothetical protein